MVVDVARYRCILYYSTSLRTVVGMTRYEYIVRCGGETVLPQTLWYLSRVGMKNLSTIGWEKVFVPLWLGYWYLFAHWFQILCMHWFVCKCCFFQMKSLSACVKVQNGYQLWSISSLSPKIQSHSNSPIPGDLSMF